MSFVTHEQQSLVWLASPLLGGGRHGFSTRRGGVSPAPWDTLNLGPGRGDAPENVEENYRRFFAARNHISASAFFNASNALLLCDTEFFSSALASPKPFFRSSL